ncbi:hypothetical protein WN982_16830 [Paraburkholderia sp. IMGN_8]|uniref:hypothetical protein n=1 Tax=Paraburkholderia sp. IMGN_8 TaxID=3136564 RepID=UPI0031015835
MDPFRLEAFDIADDASVTWRAAQLTAIPSSRHPDATCAKGSGWTRRKPRF